MSEVTRGFRASMFLAIAGVLAMPGDPCRADGPPPTTSPVTAPEGEKKTVMLVDEPAPASQAEQITRLQRMIDADKKQLTDLGGEINNPDSEYHKSEADFKALDERFTAEKEDIAKKKASGEDVGMKRLEVALMDTEKSWKLARERFELAIQTRKTLQEQVAAIESKVTQNKTALERLIGPASAAVIVVPPPATTDKAPMIEPVASNPQPPAATAPLPGAPVSPAPPVASPPPAAASPMPGTQAGLLGSSSAGDKAREQANQEVTQAEQLAMEKQRAAEEAMKTAHSLSERLATLDKDIAMEQKLLTGDRKKAELASATRENLESEYHRSADEGGREEMQAARTRVEASSSAVIKAQAGVAARMDRLQELQSDRAALQREELIAVTAAKERQVESNRAQEKVVSLKNPFALHNLLQWLLDHGPRLTLIVVAMLILQSLIKVAMKRVVDVMMQRGFRGTYEESEDRAETLVGVFQNAASTTVIVGGTLMMFEECGIAVAPLLGGAAVVGLAVAFGAQNLIRDYFYGFVILLENQYKLNDVLKIGDVSGQVERITLRMTVLRDLEGSVHFIPNGKIDCVTNMTHGWSRALFEIKVAFTEDTDNVVEMLLTIAKGLRTEPEYGRVILEDPEMLGVDALGDTSVTIKFVMKTRPLKQWMVKREMLRRIRKRFTETGIGMPIQQRVIHHRSEQLAQNLPASVVDAEQKAA